MICSNISDKLCGLQHSLQVKYTRQQRYSLLLHQIQFFWAAVDSKSLNRSHIQLYPSFRLCQILVNSYPNSNLHPPILKLTTHKPFAFLRYVLTCLLTENLSYVNPFICRLKNFLIFVHLPEQNSSVSSLPLSHCSRFQESGATIRSNISTFFFPPQLLTFVNLFQNPFWSDGMGVNSIKIYPPLNHHIYCLSKLNVLK